MEGVAVKGKRALAFFHFWGAGKLGRVSSHFTLPFQQLPLSPSRLSYSLFSQIILLFETPRFSFLSSVTDIRRILESIALALPPAPQRVNRGRVTLQLYRAISSFQRAQDA